MPAFARNGGACPGAGRARAWAIVVFASALAACSTVRVKPSAGPAAATVTVAQRGWHTDICLPVDDASPWIASLAQGFDGARFLCFGFGERQYVITRTHTPLDAMAALLPSRAAVLMTVLRASPADAFGSANVAGVGIGRDGLAGLQAFLRRSVETGPAAQPLRLADGPYPGSVFFAATGTYHAFYTCNTWTADALRAAGVPVRRAVLFSGDLMYQVRGLPGEAPRGAVPLAGVAR